MARPLQDSLNQLAVKTNRTNKDCLNLIVGNTGLNYSAEQAANIWAGTTNLRLQDAINSRAGTTGLRKQDALDKKAFLPTINGATGDVAVTTSNWIENEKYGVWFQLDASTTSAEFDSAVTRTGNFTVKTSTSGASARGRFVIGYNGGTGASLDATRLSTYAIRLKPSTSYTLTAWIKYTNLALINGALNVSEHGLTGTRNATNLLPNISGTSDWVQKTISFTTNVATVYGVISGGSGSAGDAQEFWLDINSLSLVEN